MMKNVCSEFKKHQATNKKRGKNDSNNDSVNSNGTNTSYWMNNISVHGGEDILSSGSSKNTESLSSNRNMNEHKNKLGIDVHYELNVLDQIVSEGNKDILHWRMTFVETSNWHSM